MKAITIRQPWAWAIMHAGKDVENRGRPDPWRSAVGERIAIHAAMTIETDDERDVLYLAGLDDLPTAATIRGAIIGTATLHDVHASYGCVEYHYGRCSRWAQENQHHLILTDPAPLDEPIRCRGMLGLWNVLDTALDRIPR